MFIGQILKLDHYQPLHLVDTCCRCHYSSGMRTAIYVENGVTQVVLTPETDWEKTALETVGNGAAAVRVFTGTFYDCRGGWTRQSDYYPELYGCGTASGDKSLILRVEK